MASSAATDSNNYFSSSSSTCATPTPCLSFPSPRSPPKYLDLSGKRRELVKVQILERQIGFLEEELRSCEGFQLASRSCKEVDDFVTTNPDPFISINQKIRRSRRFWKWLWYFLFFFFGSLMRTLNYIMNAR